MSLYTRQTTKDLPPRIHRAPLLSLEDCARSLGLKLAVQVTLRSVQTAPVRINPETIAVLDRVSNFDEIDLDLVAQFARLVPNWRRKFGNQCAG